MSNSVNTKNFWCFDIPGILYLKWDTLPFTIKNRIEWREKDFHVQINAYKINFGCTREISFIYDNKQYDCMLTKWKYTGGGNGIYPPQVTAKDYALKIKMTINYLSFTDTSLVKGKILLADSKIFKITDSLKKFEVIK